MWPWNNPVKPFERFGYDQVAKEMLNNQMDQGLWIKILSETKGNSEKATARYIKLRAQDVALGMHNQAVHEANVAQAKADAENAKFWWFLFLVGLGVWGVWWLTDYMDSLQLGIAYGVVLILLPICWFWVGGALSTAYTMSVVLSAIILYIANAKFHIKELNVFYWSGIALIIAVFIITYWGARKVSSARRN